MARGKKGAQGLTPEEKLAQALVPMEEQPYQIPENWCWVRLLNVANLYNGDRGKNYPSKKDYQITGIPFINAGALVDGQLEPKEFNYISEEKYNALSAGKIQCGDILYCLRGSLGKSAIVEIEGNGAISSSLCILRCTKAIDNRFLFFLLNSDIIKKQQDSAENGSAQPNLSAASVIKYMVPLPSILEQQRIVDRIESIFAKLDEAKEKAQAVVDGFELRKSAILHKAFTGELTRAWRKENGQDESNWKRVRFDEVAEIKSNLVDPAEYQEYPHIAPDNIEKKTGVLLEYHTIAEDGVKSGKHRFYAGQILYSKIRPYLSKVVIATVDGLCSADMYPIDAKGNVKFLWYYMLSDEFLAQASNSGSRSVLPKINQKELSRVMVKTTSIEEQQAIADILDSLIAKENAAKEAAESVLDQIDTMKKTVLASAFRGELGTNDPTEASAVELLKSML